MTGSRIPDAATPADRPPLWVRDHHLRHCPAGGERAGGLRPRITAIVLYLYVGQFLSKQRTADALAELFGIPMSQGTVATMTRGGADGLDEFLDRVRERVAAADVAGFDETGLRVAGALHWVHSRAHRQVQPDHLPPPTRRRARRLGAV